MGILYKIINEFELQSIMPRCADPGTWTEILNSVMESYEIKTVLRASAFLAICAQQSKELTILCEQCSEERANFLYANKLGNGGPTSGDGWKYRGRGLIQLTGRAVYRHTGTALGLPLEEQPELLEMYDLAALSAAFFWKSRGLNQFADDKNFQQIKRCVDGGNYGLDEANKYWEITQKVLNANRFQLGENQFKDHSIKTVVRSASKFPKRENHFAYSNENYHLVTKERMEHPENPHFHDMGIIDPPRSAYAVLNCPDNAVAKQEFSLVVGLGKEQSPNTSGGSMERPHTSVGPYTLTIQVVADGFMIQTGESWRRELMVTAEVPYPMVEFHLTPEAQEKNLQPRIIHAMYSVDGQTMGAAFRPINVVKTAELMDTLAPKAVEPGIDFSIPTDPIAPDLTIRILEDAEREGGLLWDFDSPHTGIIAPSPNKPIKTHIGQNPQAFTRLLINKVNLREGQEDLYPFLCGIGLEIAEKMPAEFWILFTALSEKLKRTPTVLLLSQEPYIPWELAVVEPLLDSNAPPFLSAQVNLGRWVLRQRRPKLPPPTSVQVQAMMVISGVYNNTPGWNRLVAA